MFHSRSPPFPLTNADEDREGHRGPGPWATTWRRPAPLLSSREQEVKHDFVRVLLLERPAHTSLCRWLRPNPFWASGHTATRAVSPPRNAFSFRTSLGLSSPPPFLPLPHPYLEQLRILYYAEHSSQETTKQDRWVLGQPWRQKGGEGIATF